MQFFTDWLQEPIINLLLQIFVVLTPCITGITPHESLVVNTFTCFFFQLQISQQGASYGEDTIHITKSNIHVQCLLDLLDNILLHG